MKTDWKVDLKDRLQIENFMLHLAIFVEAVLEDKGQLPNMYLIFDTMGGNGHVLKPATGMPPERTAPAINHLIQVVEGTPMAVGMVVHMSEAWGAEGKSGDDRPPSEREDRFECYIIEAKTRSGDRFYINRRFDRDASGKIVFDGTPPELADANELVSSRLLDAIFI